jgi:hypothetical protein
LVSQVVEAVAPLLFLQSLQKLIRGNFLPQAHIYKMLSLFERISDISDTSFISDSTGIYDT